MNRVDEDQLVVVRFPGSKYDGMRGRVQHTDDDPNKYDAYVVFPNDGAAWFNKEELESG